MICRSACYLEDAKALAVTFVNFDSNGRILRTREVLVAQAGAVTERLSGVTTR